MADCDELALLANRASYTVMANAVDANATLQTIQEMKEQVAKYEAELAELLLELDIRSHVASLIALPTKESLTTYVLRSFGIFRSQQSAILSGWSMKREHQIMRLPL